ncbi:twin-arginine translocation signal domain-containing protein [Cellulosimicrobium terreum]|nr:twin-arginine translocation signal domain-containing protein [Cellulosimicrobium terreum]
MSFTRRSFLGLTAAAAATAAVGHPAVAAGRSLTAGPLAAAPVAVSPPGDVVGKITAGYQGWFACRGDGAPIGQWWHWARQADQAPSTTNTVIKSWPDVREYTTTYATAFPALGDGRQARLFSSYDQQTVDTHLRWMAENGIHVAALQRFNPFGGEGPTRDVMAGRVRSAAEGAGTKFYVMYDVSDWHAMRTQITQDWATKMSAHTASSAYARQNGKPVVGIWGFGFDDPQRPFAPQECQEVIDWFHAQGCYVMGGVPTWWRTEGDDSRDGFADVYRSFDMISPWLVGRIGTVAGADDFYQRATVPDLAECTRLGIDYQPCVLPGDLQEGQRVHGDFMWRQFYNHARAGVASAYISMFDEYNEGNQIAKTAATAGDVPAGSGMRALDEDGTACSADYYLRLTDDGGRLLRGEIALTAVRPTAPVPGGSNPTDGQLVTLRSRANSRYVQARQPDGGTVVAAATAVGAWERFRVESLGGGVVALRADADGRYVCAEGAGAQPLVANRAAVGAWERFRMEELGGGAVALRAEVNGRYVCAEGAGAQPLVANRDAVGPWETFDLVRL